MFVKYVYYIFYSLKVRIIHRGTTVIYNSTFLERVTQLPSTKRKVLLPFTESSFFEIIRRVERKLPLLILHHQHRITVYLRIPCL